MPKYLIEYQLPAQGMPPLIKLKAMASKAEPNINWLYSYVTGDKCYSMYDAPNEKIMRDHARQDGLPINHISEILSIIDPTKLQASIIDPTKL